MLCQMCASHKLKCFPVIQFVNGMNRIRAEYDSGFVSNIRGYLINSLSSYIVLF